MIIVENTNADFRSYRKADYRLFPQILLYNSFYYPEKKNILKKPDIFLKRIIYICLQYRLVNKIAFKN